MCDPTEESEDPDDSMDRGQWTSYQKWSLALAGLGVVITLGIGAVQFLVAQ